MKVLVTGGAGFIGSNFINLINQNELLSDATHITVLDALTYAGKLENIKFALTNPRFTFIKGDICDFKLVSEILIDIDLIINFAAESHVDRSITDPAPFARANILGASGLATAIIERPHIKLLHVSTDEVYGSIKSGKFTESSNLAPNSPYAASKASADLMLRSFHKTYGVDIRITRACNNFGPNQYPEKLIPFFVRQLSLGKKIPIYGDGKNIREWINVSEHCKAISSVISSGDPGEIYNIGSGVELSNIDIASIILEELNLDKSHIEFVEDRKGHDFRYAVDTSKIQERCGFKMKNNVINEIRETVEFYANKFKVN